MATVEAPYPGDEVIAVVIGDGRIVAEAGEVVPGIDVFVQALGLSPVAPFRLEAVRRGPTLWAVAGRRVEVVELPSQQTGDAIEVAFDGRERTVAVDGSPALAGIPVLEALGARVGSGYVVTASRIDGTTWEVTALPL